MTERPIRVLMTADTMGGVWTYALEIARALGPRGVEVALAAMGAPVSPEQRAEAERIANLRLFGSGYKLEWMDDPWEDVRSAGEWLLDVASQVSPDLVHVNGYAHAALPWGVPVLVAGHSCVLSWWRAVHGEEAPPEWGRYKEEVSRGLAEADAVVCPTAAMLDALQQNYGLTGGHVVPNGRTAALFPQGAKKSLVFAAGRLWDEAKNIRTLACAAGQIRWPVYVAGTEAHPAGKAPRFEQVHSLGQLTPEAMAYWFGRASVYALPALYEPFGLSPLEAALAGCALVLGDIPSLREVWGDAALYVPPCDSAALAATANKLIDNPMLRARMRQRARSRALEFTPERMADRYLALYRGLLRPERSALAS